MSTEPEIAGVASRFATIGEFVSSQPFHAGHINDSHILAFRDAGHDRRYLLQRINRSVFHRPVEVMENIQRVTAHIAARMRGTGVPDVARRTLTLIPTRDGAPCFRDAAGEYWRMYDYIEGTRTLLSVETPAQAEAAGRAFGEFQALLADLPPPRLHETIPDFHNTPLRVTALERAITEDRAERVRGAQAEIDFALSHRGLATVLVDLQRSGAVPERVVHNDAKISNVLFDERTGEALCVVDLDTVMPGLSLFDFGDMVRSMTCRAAEDEPDVSKVAFDTSLFDALARGYLATAGGFLTAIERAHLFDAGRVITYEQGLRFLADFLMGDVYYHTARPRHNLDRAWVQFALLSSMAANHNCGQPTSGRSSTVDGAV